MNVSVQDDDIMANLVAYEKPSKKSKMATPGARLAGQQSSSDDEASTSEEEIDKQPSDGGKRRPAPGEVAAAAALTVLQPQVPVIEEANIDDEEDEEVTLKVKLFIHFTDLSVIWSLISGRLGIGLLH